MSMDMVNEANKVVNGEKKKEEVKDSFMIVFGLTGLALSLDNTAEGKKQAVEEMSAELSKELEAMGFYVPDKMVESTLLLTHFKFMFSSKDSSSEDLYKVVEQSFETFWDSLNKHKSE